VRQEFWANLAAFNISRRLVCQAALETANRDPDRISFSLAQDQIRASASQPTGFKVSRLAATVRDAVAVLAQARELLTRRDRACPRIVRHRGRRFPSRAAYQGPRSNRQPRRPEVFPLEPSPSHSPTMPNSPN
jgi:hypothetical protein